MNQYGLVPSTEWTKVELPVLQGAGNQSACKHEILFIPFARNFDHDRLCSEPDHAHLTKMSIQGLYTRYNQFSSKVAGQVCLTTVQRLKSGTWASIMFSATQAILKWLTFQRPLASASMSMLPKAHSGHLHSGGHLPVVQDT